MMSALLLPPLLAMSSPWWEDYDIHERYLCGEQGTLVVERNASQAALISGRNSFTLFRESSDGPGLRYRNGPMLMVLWGDSLSLEQDRHKLQCSRTDQA